MTPGTAATPPVLDEKPLANLDGVRAFACLLVLDNHLQSSSWFQNLNGKLGVLIFFTLSGFLMGYHYLPGENTLRYWGSFLVRRFFRVYIPFFIVLLLYGILHSMSYYHVFDAFSWPVVIDHWRLIKGLERFWTVRFEIRFYLFFPFIALALLWVPVNLRLPVLIFLWVLLMLLNFIFASYFIGGLVAQQLYRAEVLRRWSPSRLWDTAALIGLGLIFVVPPYIPELLDDFHNIWDFTYFFAPLLVLILLCLAKAEGYMRLIFANKAMRFTGHISYSLYLVFGPAYLILGYSLHGFSTIFFGLLGGFLLSYFFYKWVELPSNALGKRLVIRLFPATLISGL